jgi:hypothetical protein
MGPEPSATRQRTNISINMYLKYGDGTYLFAGISPIEPSSFTWASAIWDIAGKLRHQKIWNVIGRRSKREYANI